MNIEVNFQSSILINDRIFIDPFRVQKDVKVDYIFITHPHFDHLSVEDINKVIKENTIIVCPESIKEEIINKFNNEILYVNPNNMYTIGDIKFETFPAYNVNKKFHLKSYNWVGYTIFIDKKRVTITGDTDVTDELMNLKTDILLLPIGGYYTMDEKEAAKLTNIIKPKIVVPTHYGEIVGDEKAGERFKNLIDKDIKCEIKL